MSYPQGPQPPDPYQPPVVPTGQPLLPPKKKWGAGKIVLLVTGMVVLLCIGGGVLVAAMGGNANPRTPGSKVVSTSQSDVQSGSTSDSTPSARDFVLTPKITEKQCYGSAGCNVSYKVNVSYGGPSLDPDDTWVITYEATGDESGPITNQIELTGPEYTGTEQSISTKNSKVQIKIKVTDVEKQ